jgi:hypothetical protein
MSEPSDKIVVLEKLDWKIPVSKVIFERTLDWDSDDELSGCCSVRGCPGGFVMEHACYKGGDEKWCDGTCYDSGKYYAVLTCGCKAPICDNCADDPSLNLSCRICGEKSVEPMIVSKKQVMSDKKLNPQQKDRDFWMCMHSTWRNFVIKNFKNGHEYQKFVEWHFQKTGELLDITEFFTGEICDEVGMFKLHVSKYSFLKYAFSVSRCLGHQFKQFQHTSKIVCRFLAIDSFSGTKFPNVYPFFGLTAKVIERLMQNSQRRGDLSWFFVRLIARYFQKRCQF